MAAMPLAAQQDEASCVLDNLPPTERQTLTEALALGDPAKSGAAIEQSRPAIEATLLACVREYEWSQKDRATVVKAFEYGLRLDASLIRLKSNGVEVVQASAMFEALPASMHDAIFGRRPMTPEEMALLQPAFEGLVERLDGPDGNALSEYITARAAYDFYARQLLAD